MDEGQPACTISIRERLRPWTITTVPFARGAGTHQPLSSTPSAERNATSSEASSNEAGVRPAFSLSGNWKRRVVAMPARNQGTQPNAKRTKRQDAA